MLAWGLDRSGPQALGRVNDRVHTPVTAIVFCTVTGELALLALINIPQASLLGALLAQIAAFILVSAAGIAFPYRLKDIWEAAGGRRLFGVPVVALAGAGGVICLGALMVLFIANKSISAEFAVTAHLSLEFMLGVRRDGRGAGLPAAQQAARPRRARPGFRPLRRALPAAGQRAVATNVEEWAHEEYFITRPNDPVIIVAPAGAARDRAWEILSELEFIRADAVVVSDVEPPGRAGFLRLASGAPEELSPVLAALPLAQLGFQLARLAGKRSYNFPSAQAKDEHYATIHRATLGEPA